MTALNYRTPIQDSITTLLSTDDHAVMQQMMLNFVPFSVKHITTHLHGEDYTETQRKSTHRSLAKMLKTGSIVKEGSSYHLRAKRSRDLRRIEAIKTGVPFDERPMVNQMLDVGSPEYQSH